MARRRSMDARLMVGDTTHTPKVCWDEQAQYHRLKSCVGKKATRTRAEAKAYMRTYIRQHGQATNNPYTVYLCQWCGLYHWGHRPSPDSPSRKGA